MVESKASVVKSVRFPWADFAAVEALTRHTGIGFSAHMRSALKLYLRQHRQLVKEAMEANAEGTTTVT